MMPELWATLALALLAGAVVASILGLLRVAGPWALLAAVLRLAASLGLLLALLLTIVGRGAVAGAPRAVALGLALTTLVVYIVLVWRQRIDAAAPIVDLVAMGLILAGWLAGQPLELGSIQGQHGLSQVLWILLLVGLGGVMVAGSTGCMLALRAGLRPRTPNLVWPRSLDLHVLLKQAIYLALVALGAGLAVSVWWAWQAGGAFFLGSGAPALGRSYDGLVWIAITWLGAAMSLVAHLMGKRWGRWTAGLAVATAVTALLGLLSLMAPASLV